MPPAGNALRTPPLQQLARTTGHLLTFIPLSIVRSSLGLIASRLARTHPDLFARMGVHARKRFLIDPTDLPFVFAMVPDTAAPQLTAYARSDCPLHDGAISGRFIDLLDMIDGSLDGDALFFNRDLSVTGDVEAVVTLRNALDDFDGDLVREILGVFGPFAGLGGMAINVVRSLSPRRRDRG